MRLSRRSIAAALLAAAVLAVADAASTAAHAAPKGSATVAITRSTDLLFLAAPAAIEINGTKVASLGRGESFNGPIAPGPTEIKVSTWSTPGSSSYRFTAVPGKTYKMVVVPRTKNYAANVVGGLVGAAIEGGGAFEFVPTR